MSQQAVCWWSWRKSEVCSGCGKVTDGAGEVTSVLVSLYPLDWAAEITI